MRLYVARQLVRYFKHDEAILHPARDEMIKMVIWTANEIATLLQCEGENTNLQHEISLQLQINRRVFMAWFGLLTDFKKVASVAHYIEKPEHYQTTDVAKAYELLDNLCNHIELRRSVNLICKPTKKKPITSETPNLNPNIYLLSKHIFTYKSGMPLSNLSKATFLRSVQLFEEVPIESLLLIAEIAQEMIVQKNTVIFEEGDDAKCLYCIVEGKVEIHKKNRVLAEIGKLDYFGELGLMDMQPRTAGAIANMDGLLLYFEQDSFLEILEELPEIMQAISAKIIGYLRKNMEYKIA